MKHYFASAFLFTISCATTDSKVLERIPGVDEAPEWASGRKTTESNSSYVYFNTVINMTARRPEACLQVAEQKAQAEFVKYFVANNLTQTGQIDEDADAVLINSRTSWEAKGKVSDFEVQDRYWEKILEISTKEIRFKCAARIQVSRASLLRNRLNNKESE